MPDDNRPKPPRPFPPPLPGSLQGEPFPKAKSDPPPSEDEPPPTRRERMNSTPPSGSLLLSHLVDRLSDDPRDQLIKDQQLTIQLYQKRVGELQQQMPNTTPSPVPAPLKSSAPKSVAVVAGKGVFHFGKYTTLVVGVLGLADVVVGLWFPQYKGPLATIKSALGIP